jgi:hypothetical protein
VAIHGDDNRLDSMDTSTIPPLIVSPPGMRQLQIPSQTRQALGGSVELQRRPIPDEAEEKMGSGSTSGQASSLPIAFMPHDLERKQELRTSRVELAEVDIVKKSRVSSIVIEESYECTVPNPHFSS